MIYERGKYGFAPFSFFNLKGKKVYAKITLCRKSLKLHFKSKDIKRDKRKNKTNMLKNSKGSRRSVPVSNAGTFIYSL